MKCYIIHGYTASANSNWFPYLKAELQSENIEVEILDMPNSNTPKLVEWLNHLKKSIQTFNDNTIFIGHSLGCITILYYLNKYFHNKVKALYLISGFVENTPIPELQEFVDPIIDYQKIKEQAKNIYVISAKDDDIVPYKFSQILSEKLNAEFILLNNGKHFIDRDGFTKFPLLVSKIKSIKS